MDLVKQARDYARNLGGPPEEYLVWQLADEIERLQAQCEGLTQAAMNNGQDLLLKEAEVEGLRVIINRVIGEIEHSSPHHSKWMYPALLDILKGKIK